MNDTVILAATSLDNMAGGLEHNIVYLANHLAETGKEVNIITFDFPKAQSFYSIDKRVIWHKIGVSTPHRKVSFGQRWTMIKSIRAIVKSAGKNVPIICFHHGIMARYLLGTFALSRRLICSERNSLSLYNYVLARKWNLNFCLLFLANRITVQFPSYTKDYPLPLRRKITAIPNPVYPSNEYATPDISNTNGRFTLLTVARLCAQKNLSHQIHSFASLADKYPDWDFVIVGDGHLRETLQQKITALGMNKRIILVGTATNVAKHYLSAHIFSLPSQWEGFPNALAEALAYGLPAVSYTSCSGANVLIKDKENGLLVPEGSDNLAAAFETLMMNPSLRSCYGQNAIQSMAEYHPDKVFSLWDNLLSSQ